MQIKNKSPISNLEYWIATFFIVDIFQSRGLEDWNPGRESLESWIKYFSGEISQEKSYKIKPKLDGIYHAPIDLESNRPPFGSKSLVK